MGFFTAVGAFVVGSIITALLLTGVLIGWLWLSEKKKWSITEVLLVPSLLLTLTLTGWCMHMASGDAGVLGVLVGVVGWGWALYELSKPKPPEWLKYLPWVKRPKNKWSRFWPWSEQ